MSLIGRKLIKNELTNINQIEATIHIMTQFLNAVQRAPNTKAFLFYYYFLITLLIKNTMKHINDRCFANRTIVNDN